MYCSHILVLASVAVRGRHLLGGAGVDRVADCGTGVKREGHASPVLLSQYNWHVRITVGGNVEEGAAVASVASALH